MNDISTLAPLRRLGIVLAVTALIMVFVGIRLSNRGQWLPNAPDQIGAWTASDMPMSPAALQLLGSPPAYGRRYTNPFSERVEAHIIATASFDAYHEPAICMSGYGFNLTAEKQLPLFGKDKNVRAMILKNETDGQRILMYYWIQYKDGTTSTRGNLRDFRDVFPRLTVGLTTTISGTQNCIVRVYTQVHPADVQGVQARRNMNEVCRALYAELKRKGEGS